MDGGEGRYPQSWPQQQLLLRMLAESLSKIQLYIYLFPLTSAFPPPEKNKRKASVGLSTDWRPSPRNGLWVPASPCLVVPADEKKKSV